MRLLFLFKSFTLVAHDAFIRAYFAKVIIKTLLILDTARHVMKATLKFHLPPRDRRDGIRNFVIPSLLTVLHPPAPRS